jgi:glutaredoxin/glutathione-dependent peroxiredoxin
MKKGEMNKPHASRIIKTGDKIPVNIFKILNGEMQESIYSNDIFDNKRIVLFSVPGAFTPKSTNVQIPGYLKLANKIYGLNIDKIVCVSVNDAFVMSAWGEHCNIGEKILMLADAHCHFFNSLGLEMDCTRFNLGFRCERFSMIIDDGVLETLNLEIPGGPVDVSSAENIFNQLKRGNINE